MGLTVSVGVLAPARFEGGRPEQYAEYTAQFCATVTCLNRHLAERGLPTHGEPISVDGRPLELRLGSPANLHALRRLAAHLWHNGRLPPPGVDGPPGEDPALLEYQEAVEEHIRGGLRSKRIVHLPLMSYAHLVYHGDDDGWYIPVDMEMPLVLEIDDIATPWIVGSTHALLRECTHLAGALKMPVNLNPRDPHWTRRDLHKGGREPWRRHAAAAWACCSLLAACRASLRWNAVIAFGAARSVSIVEPTRPAKASVAVPLPATSSPSSAAAASAAARPASNGTE